jgi:hypothetical protein
MAQWDDHGSMNLAKTSVNVYLSLEHLHGEFPKVVSSSLLLGPDCSSQFLQCAVQEGLDLLSRDRRIQRAELP